MDRETSTSAKGTSGSPTVIGVEQSHLNIAADRSTGDRTDGGSGGELALEQVIHLLLME